MAALLAAVAFTGAGAAAVATRAEVAVVDTDKRYAPDNTKWGGLRLPHFFP